MLDHETQNLILITLGRKELEGGVYLLNISIMILNAQSVGQEEQDSNRIIGFPVCSNTERSCHHRIEDGRSTEVGIVAGAIYHIMRQGNHSGEVARIIPTFFLDVAEYLANTY